VGVHEPEQLCNLFMISNIGSFALDFTARFCVQLLNSPRDGRFIPPANGHRRAFPQQHRGDSAPDSTGAAGDYANSFRKNLSHEASLDQAIG
jgi:hypothetical protein